MEGFISRHDRLKIRLNYERKPSLSFVFQAGYTPVDGYVYLYLCVVYVLVCTMYVLGTYYRCYLPRDHTLPRPFIIMHTSHSGYGKTDIKTCIEFWMEWFSFSDAFYFYVKTSLRGSWTSSLLHFLELYGTASVAPMWFSIVLSLLLTDF